MLWKKLSDAAVVGVAIGVLTGCDAMGVGEVDARRDYVSNLSFFENLYPRHESIFTLDGVKTDYKLVAKRTENTLSILGLSGGEILSEEIYAVNGERVGLLKAGGEEFAPELPLIKFPLKSGDAYDWKGMLSSGNKQIPAEASVTTKTASMALGGKPLESIEVSVELRISGRSAHFLTFNLSREHGIFRAQIGKTLRELKP
ncbi:MAG TPA: hypothetical protein VK171_14070 [Fimbriimonas sp.]|nr:hypothetical protein [Fimbriimonas sp.]